MDDLHVTEKNIYILLDQGQMRAITTKYITKSEVPNCHTKLIS
uniref:Uncharacterized protein n=1 Tax=Rhizophora mucronata TaxID=61149 RepID=A0A2P2QW51_RHIMU